MKMYQVIKEFVVNKNVDQLEISAEKPRSTKVKVWRALKRYERETGKEPEITMSLGERSVILSKEHHSVTFYTEDGREISWEELMKGDK